MKIIKTLFLLLSTLTSAIIFAQDQNFYKHPKVIEVEIMLTKEATSFLQQRLPNQPVFVNVDIEPLRRKNGEKTEQLPYFYSEDEVSDEWDAIDTPMVILLSRIKKANIKVEVPSSLSDIEVIDLKDKLYQQLKLIPGRDSINIEKKVSISKSENSNYLIYYYMSGMTFVILAGIFLIVRFGNKGIHKNESAPGPAVSASAPSNPPMRSNQNGKNHISSNAQINSKVAGDINFKDSIRAADMLKEKLHGVVNAPIFPMLSDMLILEELAEKSLSSFGAFVFEMPRKHQQKIFFRSRSDNWFKGYVEAASVDLDCFLAVEKMLRNRVPTGSEKWEELLVQIWRLGDDAQLFLKQIPSEDAFNILSHLPKSFAVPTAKKSFPGGWARILEMKNVVPLEDQTKIEDYLERTLQLKPYFSFKSIDDYRKDLELVDYLRIASVKDEEEIYESLISDSHIFNIRPPYYVIFRSDSDLFKEFFNQYDLTDWAVAMFNAPREYTNPIYKILDDKKKYIFKNYLKQLDESVFDIKAQIELREEMAKKFKIFSDYKKMHKKEQVAEVNTNDNQDQNDEELKVA